jgi:3-methylcrotonyl-CoA carboxylase alpha subunit
VVEGDTVTIFYDPMIAKLITWDHDRPAALARLRDALADCDVVGPKSNLDFLERLVRHPAVVDATIDTGFLDHHLDEVLPAPVMPTPRQFAAIVTACLLNDEAATRRAAEASADPHSPFAFADSWRLGHAGERKLAFGWQDRRLDVRTRGAAGDYRIALPGSDGTDGGVTVQVGGAACALDAQGRRWLTAKIDGEAQRFRCRVGDGRVFLHDGTQRLVLARLPAFRGSEDTAAGTADRLLAPMPGRIVLLRVEAGATVAEGQELGIMEAMKMELSLKAPRAGTVAEWKVAAGDFVEADAVLVQLQ